MYWQISPNQYCPFRFSFSEALQKGRSTPMLFQLSDGIVFLRSCFLELRSVIGRDHKAEDLQFLSPFFLKHILSVLKEPDAGSEIGVLHRLLDNLHPLLAQGKHSGPLWLPQVLNQGLSHQCTCFSYMRGAGALT